MTNRKLIRKMLFAATLTMSTGMGIPAFAYQQYQPGEPGRQIPQGNTSVTQELNRMFQESGQTMPSMNSQDLPNANVPTQGQVRPKLPQNSPATQTVNPLQQQTAAQNVNPSQNPPARQNAAQSRQASPPAKPGVLGKFFGKLRGDTVAKNPDYRPPVPPENNAAAQKAIAHGNTHQTAAVGNNSPMAPTTGQVPGVQPRSGQVAQNAMTAPQENRQSTTSSQSGLSNKSATAQAYHGNKPQTLQPANTPVVRNGATSTIPPRSGSSVQPVNRHNLTSAATVGGGNQSAYTQPGSAPEFMPATNSNAVIRKHAAAAPNAADNFDREFQNENGITPILRSTVPNQMQNSGAAQSAAPGAAAAAGSIGTDDGFDSPFPDDTDAIAESEVLDLDSLIDIPEGPSSSDKTAAVETLQSAPPVVEEDKAAEDKAADDKAAENKAAEFEVNEIENENSTELQLGPNENPFTGIQLNAPDAEFFGGAEPAAPASEDAVPLTPVDDFSTDLPAMDLSIDGTQSGEVSAVDLPAVDEVSTDSAQPGVSPDTQNQPVADLTLPSVEDTAGKAQLQASPDVPAAMSEAETEQLRQLAEQERRKHQKLLIQSRAGQTGFKGFCPVALRERRELVEADARFSSTFGLQTYTLSSAESKAAFDAEPSRYAAAAGGSDVVMLVNSGEEQPGQLDYALWYRDRLYLFRSRETMTLFSMDPLRFASQY